MKTILTSILLAIVGLLCGCANLPNFINPPRDPTVASTDAALVGAPLWVTRFLKYEEANPELMGWDARAAAEGLRKRFAGNILNLKNAKTAYLDNRTDENASNLKRILESTLTDQNIAQGYLSGTILPQRGQGAPFAPQMGIAPPQGSPTAVDTLFERLGGLQERLSAIERNQAADRLAIGHLGKAFWSLTNQATVGNGTVTNKEPPHPQKP